MNIFNNPACHSEGAKRPKNLGPSLSLGVTKIEGMVQC